MPLTIRSIFSWPAQQSSLSANRIRASCFPSQPADSTRSETARFSLIRSDGSRLPHGRTPDIIISDLNMPCTSGLQVLSFFRTDARLHSTPIVIFSTSTSYKDQAEAKELGATAYFVKPTRIAGYQDLMRMIIAHVFPGS